VSSFVPIAGWDDDPDLVRAAGGVLWRRTADELEILLVHRPRYNDWSLPKGKLDAGETHEDAARREVAEETGFAVELGDELASARYWAMTVTGGEFVANHETDEVRWLPLDRARDWLTYAHDVLVVESFRPPDAA
jgi:8-oxo-dGTP pyrophosphatase MutT (NUDIX family)